MFLFTVLMITRKIKISCVAHIYIAVGQHYSKVLFKHSSQSDLFEMSDLFSVQTQIPQRLFSYLAQGKSQSFQWAQSWLLSSCSSHSLRSLQFLGLPHKPTWGLPCSHPFLHTSSLPSGVCSNPSYHQWASESPILNNLSKAAVCLHAHTQQEPFPHVLASL